MLSINNCSQSASMEDKKMDIVIVVLFIIIALSVVAIVILSQVKQYREHETSIYERRLRAESEYDARIMAATKIVTFGGTGFVTVGVGNDGRVILQAIVKTDDQPAQAIDAEVASARSDAVQLVSDSITKNGADSKKLMTADDWQALGHRRDDWQAAINWLCSNADCYTSVGGKTPGSFTRRSSLQDLMLFLAIRSLPPRSALAEAQSNSGPGNVGTVRNG